MEPQSEQQELKALILENQRLLSENNEILMKMQRSAVRHFWLNVAWIVFLLGAPTLLFYRFVMPMYESFGLTPSSVSGQLQEVNELRALLQEQR